jgi:hypothetical protein
MHNEEYQGHTPAPDRRRISEFSSLASLIEGLSTRIDSLDKRLTEHMITEPAEIKKVIEDIMQASFPDGDPDGHRRHHEALIKKAEESAAFWHEMRLAVAKWAGLGLLAFLVTAAWSTFLQGPHK